MIEHLLPYLDAIGVLAVGWWVAARMIKRLDDAIDRLISAERAIAVLQSRETADYDRLAGIETRLKALETCQGGMKADVAAIRALLEAKPRAKRPVAASK